MSFYLFIYLFYLRGGLQRIHPISNFSPWQQKHEVGDFVLLWVFNIYIYIYIWCTWLKCCYFTTFSDMYLFCYQQKVSNHIYTWHNSNAVILLYSENLANNGKNQNSHLHTFIMHSTRSPKPYQSIHFTELDLIFSLSILRQ